MWPSSRRAAAAIGARLLREYRGRTVTLLAPLVVARKGFYTDLAKWAAKKGYRELRVDGVQIPTARWPRLNRFKEHTIELPVATLARQRQDRVRIESGAWARRWTMARAW